MDKRLKSKSKFLSLVLRHQPGVIGLQLDPEGWLEINALIENANASGTDLSLVELHEIVSENDKQRFTLSEDGLRIRANQGHSVTNVELNLTPTEPPSRLYHGTVSQFLNSIREQGLQKRSRNHVHLSAEIETARSVGSRRGKPVVLVVNAQEMFQQGHAFLLSRNGVWLTDHVPETYLQFPDPS